MSRDKADQPFHPRPLLQGTPVMSASQILSYDLAHYPFPAVLEDTVYRIRPLECLHQYWSRTKAKRHGTSVMTYSDNLALRQLMQNLPDNSPFMRIYHRFVREVIAPLYGGKISYSNRPKFRIHLAGTPKVSEWHCDNDVTGRPDQINVFLPFTPCFGGNTLWCETSYGSSDFQPLEVSPGEAWLFDGGYLRHGTVDNDTRVTRCSLDFRFAPLPGSRFEVPWSLILSARPEEFGGDPLASLISCSG